MGLDKFMKKNEFANELETKECKEKIKKMLEDWNIKYKQIEYKEKEFFDKSISSMKYFLTKELNFIEDANGKDMNYIFKNGNENENYKIEIKCEGFDKRNFITFKLNQKEIKEYTFKSDLKGDIEWENIEWELKEQGLYEPIEYELERTNGIKIQDKKENWNRELKNVENIYINNLEIFNNIKDLNEKQIFEISTICQEPYSDDIFAYDSLKQFIKEILESN